MAKTRLILFVLVLGVALMSWSILEISDGTTTVNLIAPTGEGFQLNRWRPNVYGYKGGGTFLDSSLADNRRPAFTRFESAIETFDLKVSESSPDKLIARKRTLRQLLEKGSQYWKTDWQNTPVYLKAKAYDETNPRYAIITDAHLPEDDNPYAQPFFQRGCIPVMDALTLTVEHLAWQDQIPTEGACLQLSATQDWAYAQTAVSDSPAANADDAQIWITELGFFNLAATVAYIGNENVVAAGPTIVGIRFPTVNVPQGATIIDAYITVEATANNASTDCRVYIRGEDVDDAAQFSTEQDFRDRTTSRSPNLTSATVYWPTDDGSTSIEAFVVGTTYDTPKITRIVQEIVDRSGWTANNDMVFYMFDNGSTGPPVSAYRGFALFGNATYAAPVLNITYSSDLTFGQEATCEREAYIANKHNRAQLTHIFRYDASLAAFSANLVTSTAYDLFTNPIEDADITYFGIETALVDSGPFSSLVFDINSAAVYTGVATIEWEYWNGAAWAALSTSDRTNTTGPFSNSGVNGVHWVHPSLWAATAINGVTAYWVRARAVITTPPGDSITTPSQQNRYVYTIVWPYVDIAAGQTGGDIPSLIRCLMQNSSDGVETVGSGLYTNHVVVGTRSISRGANFTAFINLADEQNAIGINIDDQVAAFANDISSETGRALFFNPAGVVVLQPACFVNLDQTIASNFYGTYHVYLRGYQLNGSVGDITVRIRARVASVTMWQSRTIEWPQVTLGNGPPIVVDMGQMRIPPSPEVSQGDLGAEGFTFSIDVGSTSATPDVYLHTVILIPVDEWAALFTDNYQNSRATSIGYENSTNTARYLDIDSIVKPKRILRAILRNATIVGPGDGASFPYVSIAAKPAQVQYSGAQRLWFLCFGNLVADPTTIIAQSETSHHLNAYIVKRYYSMRGAS